MKILHVTPTYVPAWRYGGPIVSVHGLCRALVRRGHQVSVYTTTVDGEGELSVPVASAQDVDGVEVSYFRCDGPRRLYWSTGLRRALAGCVRSFQIVHAHACFLLPPTWAARSAAAEPDMLYLEGEGSFEFERTASRLHEMQSPDWGA